MTKKRKLSAAYCTDRAVEAHRLLELKKQELIGLQNTIKVIEKCFLFWNKAAEDAQNESLKDE